MRWRRYRTRLAIAAVLALVLWGLGHLGPALVVFRPAEPPDAIVPLASHEWERLPATVALARQYPFSIVLLTLPVMITNSNCHRCAERSQWLIDRGVAAERIQTLPDRGRGTHDEAVAARRYAEQHAIRRLAIVTSPYHTRRALATFHHIFKGLPVEIGVYPASGNSPARPSKWWAHGYDRAYVAYEWMAALYYRFEYGIPLAAGTDGSLPVESESALTAASNPRRR
jgi:uncharacterized SAM-binding protein YcdF (DUF218 family)